MTDQPYDLPLFIPATKPDRIPKALSLSQDAIIVDLEDAVSELDKSSARDSLLAQRKVLEAAQKPVFVRVNARSTKWFEGDVAACSDLRLAGVMLPKAESPEDLDALRDALPDGALCLALIETAAGLTSARHIARVADRLVFGSVDFCADLGCDHERTILLPPRQELVIASRLANRPAPLDGVTTAISDDALIYDDARHAVSLGFGGKLLIHPAQIAPARRGLDPSEEQIIWAEKVLAASNGEAVAVDGLMIDTPVLSRARAIQLRAQAQKGP